MNLNKICLFTLKVRATNLQDLVYKNGQAGINKATVSVTFDNTNKEQSPIGMEAHNEITVRLIFLFQCYFADCCIKVSVVKIACF